MKNGGCFGCYAAGLSVPLHPVLYTVFLPLLPQMALTFEIKEHTTLIVASLSSEHFPLPDFEQAFKPLSLCLAQSCVMYTALLDTPTRPAFLAPFPTPLLPVPIKLKSTLSSVHQFNAANDRARPLTHNME